MKWRVFYWDTVYFAALPPAHDLHDLTQCRGFREGVASFRLYPLLPPHILSPSRELHVSYPARSLAKLTGVFGKG